MEEIRKIRTRRRATPRALELTMAGLVVLGLWGCGDSTAFNDRLTEYRSGFEDGALGKTEEDDRTSADATGAEDGGSGTDGEGADGEGGADSGGDGDGDGDGAGGEGSDDGDGTIGKGG